jgi:hypothetical protein
MVNKNYKENWHKALEAIKFLFLGEVGEYYLFGAMDLAAIGVFFVFIAAITIHYNFPLWMIIPFFMLFSFLRATFEMSTVF